MGVEDDGRRNVSTLLATEEAISKEILKAFEKHEISTANGVSLDIVQLPAKN